MFERAYTFYTIQMSSRAEMDAELNAAVAELDHPNAAASVACMTAGNEEVHFLIEYWRLRDGDTEQDPARTVDTGTAPRKSRRPRTRQDDDAGATQRMEPESVNLPLE